MVDCWIRHQTGFLTAQYNAYDIERGSLQHPSILNGLVAPSYTKRIVTKIRFTNITNIETRRNELHPCDQILRTKEFIASAWVSEDSSVLNPKSSVWCIRLLGRSRSMSVDHSRLGSPCCSRSASLFGVARFFRQSSKCRLSFIFVFIARHDSLSPWGIEINHIILPSPHVHTHISWILSILAYSKCRVEYFLLRARVTRQIWPRTPRTRKLITRERLLSC